MTITLDAAFKVIKQENERIGRLRELRSKRALFVSEEATVETDRPAFSLEDNAKELAASIQKISALKHAINQFNATHEVWNGKTVDECLVLMAFLSKEKDALGRYRNIEEKSRWNSRTVANAPTVEYQYRNYPADYLEKLYADTEQSIMEIQSAINVANVTQTIEVNI